MVIGIIIAFLITLVIGISVGVVIAIALREIDGHIYEGRNLAPPRRVFKSYLQEMRDSRGRVAQAGTKKPPRHLHYRE